MGRKGAGWGGAVGLPRRASRRRRSSPRPCSARPPAVSRARFAKHRVESGIHDKIGETLPPGSAAIIATYDEDQSLAVQQALAGALARSVVQTDKSGTGALKDSLAEAMGKFAQDRTVLPIPDPDVRRIDRAGRWTRRWATGR